MNDQTHSISTAYRGRLQGLLLDWAGTIVDHGSLAPTVVFVECFRSFGIEVQVAEARVPMGKHKREHIRQVVTAPRIAALWAEKYGHAPTDQDVDRLYEAFLPRQIAVIRDYADLIPGALETLNGFRARGLKIGTCTGYTRAMMSALLPVVEAEGFTPDSVVCPDEVPAGRPAPWMAFRNAEALGIYPMAAMVKVGDTPVDVEEGINAGMWTIALARTGNELGLTAPETAALSGGELQSRLEPIYARLRATGAHYVVDSLSDVPPILELIEARLGQGERP